MAGRRYGNEGMQSWGSKIEAERRTKKVIAEAMVSTGGERLSNDDRMDGRILVASINRPIGH